MPKYINDESETFLYQEWANYSEAFYKKKSDSIYLLLNFDEAKGDCCDECKHVDLLLKLNSTDTSAIDINKALISNFSEVSNFKYDSLSFKGHLNIEKIKRKRIYVNYNFTISGYNNTNHKYIKTLNILVNFSDQILNDGKNKRSLKYSRIYDWVFKKNSPY